MPIRAPRPGSGGQIPVGQAPASAEPADESDDHLISLPGRSPVLDAAQLEVLRRYGSERDVAAGDVLFADGDQTYDLIVLLAGTADIVEGYGQPGTRVVASYGPSEFLGEIGMLTGQRAFLTAVATSPGRVLAVRAAQLRRAMAREPGLSDLILRTFLLRHSILMSRGTGLTLIGSRFDADTRRLLEVLARNRLVWTWLDLESAPEAEQILQGLDVPVADLPVIIVPGGPVLRNPGGRELLDTLGVSGEAGSDPSGVCDLLVVGAGPAGLAASVHGASEGLATTLAEDTALGGQAGTSSRIDTLAAQGAAVALAARRRAQLEELAAGIREGGGTALVLECDVTDQEQAASAVERTVAELGRLDTLVNNAGVMLLGPAAEAPLDEWQQMVDLNVLGLLYCAHAALPHLLRAAGGHPRVSAVKATVLSYLYHEDAPG